MPNEIPISESDVRNLFTISSCIVNLNELDKMFSVLRIRKFNTYPLQNYVLKNFVASLKIASSVLRTRVIKKNSPTSVKEFSKIQN